jgi:hypothetical protein
METTMAKISFEALVSDMDRQAQASGDARCWWNTASLVLTVWSNCKDGWFPAVRFDPRVNRNLDGLSKAFKLFGADLLNAANARAFA